MADTDTDTVTLTLTREQVALVLLLATNEAACLPYRFWPENRDRCRFAGELAALIVEQTGDAAPRDAGQGETQ